LIRSELDAALARPRYERGKKAGREGTPGITGHRHGSRLRSLTVSFGPIEIAVPRARLNTADGKTTEWKSQSLRAYQRRTLAADALIASCYLAGTNTRRVRRALSALFAGALGKRSKQPCDGSMRWIRASRNSAGSTRRPRTTRAAALITASTSSGATPGSATRIRISDSVSSTSTGGSQHGSRRPSRLWPADYRRRAC
jgi:hypothetical protein